MWNAWAGEEHYVGFWWGNLKERHNFENLEIGERIILKCVSDMLGGRGLGLSVASFEHWLIILNRVMNNQVLHNMRIFLKI
jgi:hypothetical protein